MMSCKSRVLYSLQRFHGVHDLNCTTLICDAFGIRRPGVWHERRQNAVCAGDGVCTVEDLWTHRGTAQGRCRSAHTELCRLVPHRGLLSTHLARVVARYRGPVSYT